MSPFNTAFLRLLIVLATAFTSTCVFSSPSGYSDSTRIEQSFENRPGASDFNSAEIKTPGDVLIFISFSMPPASIRQWFIQADKIHAPVIIRGLINQSFRETQAKIVEIASEYKNGVVLDPRLFQEYQITAVPAVVVRNSSAPSCSSAESCWHLYPYDVIYGDVGLDYALQTVIKQGGSGSSIAEQVLQRLRETFP